MSISYSPSRDTGRSATQLNSTSKNRQKTRKYKSKKKKYEENPSNAKEKLQASARHVN